MSASVWVFACVCEKENLAYIDYTLIVFLLNFTVKNESPVYQNIKNSDYKLQALQDGSLVNFTVPT